MRPQRCRGPGADERCRRRVPRAPHRERRALGAMGRGGRPRAALRRKRPDSAALARGRHAIALDRREPPLQDLRGRDLARQEIRMSYRQKPNGTWVVEIYDPATKEKTHVKARDYGMQVPRTERQAKALERAALNARDARAA